MVHLHFQSNSIIQGFSSTTGFNEEKRTFYRRVILYNYRLLMRSTHDHEDRVRYWLTDAEGGGQPIPDKVFMVMSRPKSKVYYCFIKLSGIFLQQDCHIYNDCIFIAPLQYV